MPELISPAPPLLQSKTKKWGVFGAMAVAVLQASKLVVPVEYHRIIDALCDLLAGATVAGVTVGLRNAIAASGPVK